MTAVMEMKSVTFMVSSNIFMQNTEHTMVILVFWGIEILLTGKKVNNPSDDNGKLYILSRVYVT